jgi:hypothetical protein
MHNDLFADKFQPFKDALKSKFNIFCLLIGVTFLIDFLLGGPLVYKLMVFQYQLRGIDVTVPKFTILTLFGMYRDIYLLSLTYDKVFSIFFLVFPGLSYLKGFLSSFSGD